MACSCSPRNLMIATDAPAARTSPVLARVPRTLVVLSAHVACTHSGQIAASARPLAACSRGHRAKLRLDPLAGAVACLPLPESAHFNPWLLNWRTLSTEVSCHLQDLLRPLPHTALPPSLLLEEGEEELDVRSMSNILLPVYLLGLPLATVVLLRETWKLVLRTSRRKIWRNRR